MLEHLRMGPLKKTKVPNDSEDLPIPPPPPPLQPLQSRQTAIEPSNHPTVVVKGNGTIQNNNDEVDNSCISVTINETRKKSLKEIPNGVVNLMECEKKFDPKKRYSIGNGDLRVNGKSRELSPSTRMTQQRKLSADMRLRGSNNHLHDEYVMRRPVRLKSLTTNFEVYDSLHTKATDVSTLLYTLFNSFFFLFIFYSFRVFHFPHVLNVFQRSIKQNFTCDNEPDLWLNICHINK